MASSLVGGSAASLKAVLDRVQQAADRSNRNVKEIRVVAASKTKPVSVLRQVYDAGHRFFGENYVQEIIDKAPQVCLSSSFLTPPYSCLDKICFIVCVTIPQLPEDIEWHFIGNLQSNKVKPLLGMVFSVDSVKLSLV